MTWKRFWFGALSVLLAVEIWAVLNGSGGDTLTEQIVPLLSDPLVWLVTLVAWIGLSGWLVWHFWFDRRR